MNLHLSTTTANNISLSGLIPPSTTAFTHTLYLPSYFSRPLNPQTDNSWTYFCPLLQQTTFHCPDWYHPPLRRSPTLCIYHHISAVPSTPRHLIHELTSVHYYSKQHFTVRTDATLCCGVHPHFVSTITFQACHCIVTGSVLYQICCMLSCKIEQNLDFLLNKYFYNQLKNLEFWQTEWFHLNNLFFSIAQNLKVHDTDAVSNLKVLKTDTVSNLKVPDTDSVKSGSTWYRHSVKSESTWYRHSVKSESTWYRHCVKSESTWYRHSVESESTWYRHSVKSESTRYRHSVKSDSTWYRHSVKSDSTWYRQCQIWILHRERNQSISRKQKFLWKACRRPNHLIFTKSVSCCCLIFGFDSFNGFHRYDILIWSDTEPKVSKCFKNHHNTSLNSLVCNI